MKIYYGIKKDQIHTYNQSGKRLFVTRLVTKPLLITQIKSAEKDKYLALQVGLGNKKRINKPISVI